MLDPFAQRIGAETCSVKASNNNRQFARTVIWVVATYAVALDGKSTVPPLTGSEANAALICAPISAPVNAVASRGYGFACAAAGGRLAWKDVQDVTMVSEYTRL